MQEAGLDYADLVLVHRPPRRGAGAVLWQGLLRARDAGIARDVGLSNYSIEQLEVLWAATGELPGANQIEWSPFGWSPEMLRYCRERRIVVRRSEAPRDRRHARQRRRRRW